LALQRADRYGSSSACIRYIVGQWFHVPSALLVLSIRQNAKCNCQAATRMSVTVPCLASNLGCQPPRSGSIHLQWHIMMSLTVYSPAVTICTAQRSLYVPPVLTSTILRSAHTVYLCVLCGSENKQRLFHCTTLTGWFIFITEMECLLRGTFCVLPTQCIYVFCVDLRTNSDYFTVQH